MISGIFCRDNCNGYGAAAFLFFLSVASPCGAESLGWTERERENAPDSVEMSGSPLSVEFSAVSDTELDLRAFSSLRAGNAWKTFLSGKASGNIKSFDFNGDGYMDEPLMSVFGFSNGWRHGGERGSSIEFGAGISGSVSAGGQKGYDHNSYSIASQLPWGSEVSDISVDAYFRASFPVCADGPGKIVMSAGYTWGNMDSRFGEASYSDMRHSGKLKVYYSHKLGLRHAVSAGVAAGYERIDERLERKIVSAYPALSYVNESDVSHIANAGIFGKYDYRAGKRFCGSAALRGDWYRGDGFRMSPDISLVYSPVQQIDIRLEGRRRLGYSVPLSDNMGVFATGKAFRGSFLDRLLEDSWVFGGSVSYRLPFGLSDAAFLRVGYFRTIYGRQMVADREYEWNVIDFYALDDSRSYSDAYEAELNVIPLKGFTLNASVLYRDSKTDLKNHGLVETPLEKRFRGVLGMEYATTGRKWVFGLSTAVYGTARVYDFMLSLKDAAGNLVYPSGRTPAYPDLRARISRKFGMAEVYLGGENLTGFRQKVAVLGGADREGFVNPRQPSFDASALWGPLTGIKVYVGVRFVMDTRDK